MHFLRSCLTFILASHFLFPQPASAVQYKLKNFYYMGAYGWAQARKINDNRIVMGYSKAVNAPFIYDGTSGSIQTLGQFPNAAATEGIGLNSSGHIVGSALVNGNGGYPTAFLFDGVAYRDLGPGSARAINDNGDIALAASATTMTPPGSGILLQGETRTLLGTLGGTTSTPNDINNAGVIVGKANLPGDASGHAFVYQNGAMSDLGTLGGKDSVATALNEQGQVIGYASTAEGQDHAFLYENGAMKDLGTLGGSASAAYDINERGQIVGMSLDQANSLSMAFIYENGVMTDLNSLIINKENNPPFSRALGINNLGQIVGFAAAGYTPPGYGLAPALLLTPVTPPASTVQVNGLSATITATDSDFGVKEIHYRLNGGEEVVVTGETTTFTPPPGTSSLSYYAIDQEDNQEESKYADLYIDNLPPATVATITGTGGANNWYTSATSILLHAADNVAVGGIHYVADGASGYTGFDQLSHAFTADGSHSLDFYAVDTSGNQEQRQTIAVAVDSTVPETVISFSGTTGNSGWYRSAVTVSVTGTDATSGVAATGCSFDQNSWTGYDAPFLLTAEGATTFSCRSVDHAGNIGVPLMRTVLIDTVAPVLSNTVPANGARGVALASEISVTFTEPVAPGPAFSTIVLITGGAEVSTSKVISGNSLIIKSAVPLAKNARYTVRIPAAGVTDLAGNGTATEYAFNFTSGPK